MKMPIPQDYEPESGLTCFKIQWPDTPFWIGILQGLITSIQLGRIWDEKTGSIIGVQAIGREIEQANLPLVLCSGGSTGEQDTDDEARRITQYVSGSMLEHLFGVDEMTLCGYNPKAFKIENGALFVRDFCGEWTEIGELFSPAEDAPSNPFEGEDPQPTLSPCGKVAALIDAFVALSNAAWAAYDDLPTLEVQMRAAVPSATLSRARIYQWPAQILLLEPFVDASWFNNSEMIALARCIAVGNVGTEEATGDEVNAVINALGSAMQRIYGLIPQLYYNEYWNFVQETIGATDSRLIMSLGGKDDSADCECPDVGSYDGALAFTGFYDAPQHPEWVNSVEIGDNGRYVDISWTTPPGFSKNEDSFKLFMSVDGSVTHFVLKVTALNGNVPLNSQTTSEYCGNPDFWTQPGIIWTPVASDVWVTVGGARYNTTILNDPTTEDMTLDSYFCDCPSNETGDNKTYNFRYELVQVNGEDVV